MEKMIHPSSDVQCENIGENTFIWQFCVVLRNAIIGRNCNINANVFIENDVVIGDNVTVKSGVQLWNGISLEDNVFVGPNVTFTNDVRPRSKSYPDTFLKTIVRKGATIGANTTVLPGIEIGQYAMVGAGSVITASVPDRALVFGNPARIKSWLNLDGTPMEKHGDRYLDKDGTTWVETESRIERLTLK